MEDIRADTRYCEKVAGHFGPQASTKPFYFGPVTGGGRPIAGQPPSFRDRDGRLNEHTREALLGIAASSNQAKVLKFCLSDLGYEVGKDPTAE